MRRTTAAPALLCLALLAGAAGCGGSDGPDGEDAGAGPATPSASATATSDATGDPDGSDASSASPSTSPTTAGGSGAAPGGPPFPTDLRPADGGRGRGNGLGVTGVRVGRQPGFDRVVFDLGGRGQPGWRVEYVDRPLADGSGEPVRLRGTAFLEVVLRGVGMPADTGVPAYGDFRTRVPGTGGVAEVAPGTVFEGEQQAFVGLTGRRRPFRVFALRDPVRVVVDVRRP